MYNYIDKLKMVISTKEKCLQTDVSDFERMMVILWKRVSPLVRPFFWSVLSSFSHANRFESFVALLTFLPTFLSKSKISFHSYECLFVEAFFLSFLSLDPPFPCLSLPQRKSSHFKGSYLISCILSMAVVGIIFFWTLTLCQGVV